MPGVCFDSAQQTLRKMLSKLSRLKWKAVITEADNTLNAKFFSL